MSIIRHCLIAGLILVVTSAVATASQIYRTVDEDGNVVFTDIPPREDQDAEQVIVETPNSFAVEEAAPEREAWIVEQPEAAEEAPFSYRTLNVASPQDDEAVRENAGNITIVANVNPRLQPGHVMRLLMDGTVAQEGAQSTFALANVDRGTHTIVLEIVDEQGRVLIRSADSTFHMLRFRIPG